MYVNSINIISQKNHKIFTAILKYVFNKINEEGVFLLFIRIFTSPPKKHIKLNVHVHKLFRLRGCEIVIRCSCVGACEIAYLYNNKKHTLFTRYLLNTSYNYSLSCPCLTIIDFCDKLII